MWRAVCFDLDGTLVRYHGDFDQLLDGLRTDLGLFACDFATFRSRLSRELRQDGPVTLTTAVAATLELLQQRLPEDLPAVIEASLNRYVTDLSLLPGARELLADLTQRGVPLALITNGPSDMQRSGIAALDLAGYFEAVLVSGDRGVGVRKPGRRIFEQACERLGVAIQDSVMVGDDPDKDIEGAIAAGMAALQVHEPGAAAVAGQIVDAGDSNSAGVPTHADAAGVPTHADTAGVPIHADTAGVPTHFSVADLGQARSWLLRRLPRAAT